MSKKQMPIDAGNVLQELGKIGFAAQDGDGPEVKTAEKMKALELIGRHLGMFEGAAQEDAEKFTVEVKVVE